METEEAAPCDIQAKHDGLHFEQSNTLCRLVGSKVKGRVLNPLIRNTLIHMTAAG